MNCLPGQTWAEDLGMCTGLPDSAAIASTGYTHPAGPALPAPATPMEWIQQNPLIAYGIAAVILLLVFKGRR